MKIILFGSTGMLGNYISHYLQNKLHVICVTRNDYDIENVTYESLFTLLENYSVESGDVIINAAGCIPQKNPELKSYYLVNTIFPQILSLICDDNSVRLIHITTDCVFSGSEGLYKEDDYHTETNIYGISKSLGENINATIIRTSIIGEENTNGNYSLLEWVRNSKNTILGYSNHKWNGITCLELSKIIYKIIKDNIFWNGVYHIYSFDYVTKYELVKMIASIYNVDISVKKYETETAIDKTLISNSDINQYFNIPDIFDQIVEQKEYNIYSRLYT